MESEDAAATTPADFTIAHQVVNLDIDFPASQIRGSTEITIYPTNPKLRDIKLNSRQCEITRVLVNNLKPLAVKYQDPCDQLSLHGTAGIHQHHILEQKICSSLPELIITLPKGLKIEEVNLTEVHTRTAGTIKISRPEAGAADIAETSHGLSDTSSAKFTPLTLFIEFISSHLRDGCHFVQGRPGNGRWPHVYTRGKLSPGAASCIFPCLDRITARCTWDLSIRCPRTVSDAMRQTSPSDGVAQLIARELSSTSPSSNQDSREMSVICSGDVTDEIMDKGDSTRKTVSFSCSQQLSAQQVGFAVGPFERVNLSSLREAHEEEHLGQNAVDITAYCLPGRIDEVKNTCLPTTQAIDFIVRKYFACPFRSYSMCFTEENDSSTSTFAGLTICSTRLLYPEDVIDPAQDVTRTLVQAISSQWVGVNIVAEEPRDTWVILGISHFITESFMKELCGNNEYRFRIKKQSDMVCDLDHNRPSIYEMGALLHVDPSEHYFLSMKAPLVLFILDRRIAKMAGTSKMPGIIGKILTRARIGELPDNFLSTETFQKTCERFYHAKIDDFLNQWVKGGGCPRFQVLQRFNKKKLVVEMVIQQVQGSVPADRDLEASTFMRDAREDFHLVYAAPLQPIFTGSMTIRIHEADGTPYEHIVELKDVKTAFDIPYNTKYKRLKRSKRQKSKNAADVGDGENDSLVYCLGDVLQTEDEVLNWRLTDWSPEDEERMNAESYEWIRIDADFEWICRIQLQMPGYMSVSQLQQDRDVVAQYESIHHINNYPASPLISSILLRTMMDRRYFHGIRSLAARSLVKHAKPGGDANNIGWYHLKKAFEELYCVSDRGGLMTRPNEFSDVPSYYLQGQLIEAISKVRDENGNASRKVKEFLLDKLKFNDNTSNKFSDAFHISRLMRAISLAVVVRPSQTTDVNMMDIDAIEESAVSRQIEQECIAEIDRYRRMDEWTSSYQNLYSRTALDCQHILTQAGIGRYGSLHFLQYTRPGNFDLLRLAAYENLVRNNVFDNTSVLRYVIHCMVADPSPAVRHSLSQYLGEAFAQQAIGGKMEVPPPLQHQDSLVIEDPAIADARQKALTRRKTLEGATAALGGELGQDVDLQNYLWNAIRHPDIGLVDLKALLDICRLLYEPIDELKVGLRLPRFWEVKSLGKGKLRFRRTTKIRTKPVPKWQPPVVNTVPRTDIVRPGKANITLKLTKADKALSPASTPIPTPPPPIAESLPAAPQTQRIRLKLKPEED